MKNWFDADKQGLARLFERKSKEFVLFELIQNGWDAAGVTNLSESLQQQGRNRAVLVRRLGQGRRSVLKMEMGRAAGMPP